MQTEIIPFEPQYAEVFAQLNKAWLEEYFFVEKYDEEILENPEKYILAKGGFVFLLRIEDKIVGTVALIKVDAHTYELSKMAVEKSFRGKKFGHKLLEFSLQFSERQNINTLVLYSSRKLGNALHLYQKFGFEEVQMESGVAYERADIKMILKLNKQSTR